MNKTDWTAEEVRHAIDYASKPGIRPITIGIVEMLSTFAERIAADESSVPVVWVDPDDVAEKRKAVMGTADPYEHKGTRYKLPLFIHPPAQPVQPAQLDCPKCHGTGEVSDSDGLYVGQCTACRAIKQPAQEQPGGKVPEGWARTEAKLHERKTVHEWLNDLHIEREEFGKSLCLLRRLRILCDRYADTCAQLSFEILKQAGWISIAISQPERNATAIYWHMSEHGGFPDIADEWRDEHHLAKASHWMEYASPTPPKEN